MADHDPVLAPEALAWGADGLLPAVVQQHDTGEVLMLAWVSPAALERMGRTGLTTFHSRSRGRLWTKGETSGNVQRVVEVRADCDADALLVLVDQQGPDGGAGVACHTGRRTCFHLPVAVDGGAGT